MTRNSVDIRTLAIRNAINPGIRFASSFQEWEAGTAAGLDMWKWESGAYPVRFKERVVAWYNLHSLINTHSQDAAATAAKKKAKRGKR